MHAHVVFVFMALLQLSVRFSMLVLVSVFAEDLNLLAIIYCCFFFFFFWPLNAGVQKLCWFNVDVCFWLPFLEREKQRGGREAVGGLKVQYLFKGAMERQRSPRPCAPSRIVRGLLSRDFPCKGCQRLEMKN
jgi:hypothetical protein